MNQPAYNLSDTRRIEFFTRPYDGRTPETEISDPKPANDNSKHDWPVRDYALANKLMEGSDETETAMLNLQALSILIELRALLDVAAPPGSWLKHNGHGSEDEGEPYGTGFRQEVLSDLGPSVATLKVLFEDGAKAAPEGSPWNHGPCKLLKVENDLGKTIKKLWQVGSLRFNEHGHLTQFKTKDRWLKILDRTRGPKGRRRPKADADNDNSLAGKVGSIFSVPEPSEQEPPETGHRPAQSSADPYAEWKAETEARGQADLKLAAVRSQVGKRPYDALVDAATGARLDDIGGKRDDKRAIARGKTLVQVAIERLAECRNLVPQS